MKRVSIIFIVVLITPLLIVSLVRAAGDWRPIGQTQSGDRVSISSVRVLKNNQRTALVRVEYKEPTKLPQGGPFVELRARVRFNCSTGQTTPNTEWLYSRDRSGRLVVSKKATHDDQFGKESEGGFGEMTIKAVCSQGK